MGGSVLASLDVRLHLDDILRDSFAYWKLVPG